MRSIFIVLAVTAGLAACGGGPEAPKQPEAALPAAQPNPLQTQADALQKARDMQARLEQAEKQRQQELDAMTGN
jgi:hypothetical protein